MSSAPLNAGFEQVCARLESFPKTEFLSDTHVSYQVGPCVDGLNRVEVNCLEEQVVSVAMWMPYPVYQAFEAVAPVTVLDDREVTVALASCVISGTRHLFHPISMRGALIVELTFSLGEQDFDSGVGVALVDAFVGVAK